MSERVNVSNSVDLTSTVLVLFFVFWWQSGWYRIDCAIGVQKACELIAAEKEYQPKPVPAP